MRIGVMGYGKAGKAVASVLANDSRYQLAWVLRRSTSESDKNPQFFVGETRVPVQGIENISLEKWLECYPVDALVDFSVPDSVFSYGPFLSRFGIALVTAISAYEERHLDYLRTLGEDARILCSPNITLGINFLMMAAKLLREIAPFADVEIIEQHFREKPEISGTARKIADSLSVETDQITSLRLGGIVGHHEVIFGFPHQTVRLVHESIRREAFGTGAAFALDELRKQPVGFYTLDQLLNRKIYSFLTESGW